MSPVTNNTDNIGFARHHTHNMDVNARHRPRTDTSTFNILPEHWDHPLPTCQNRGNTRTKPPTTHATRSNAHTYTHTHTYLHTYILTYTHTYIQTYKQTYIPIYDNNNTRSKQVSLLSVPRSRPNFSGGHGQRRTRNLEAPRTCDGSDASLNLDILSDAEARRDSTPPGLSLSGSWHTRTLHMRQRNVLVRLEGMNSFACLLALMISYCPLPEEFDRYRKNWKITLNKSEKKCTNETPIRLPRSTHKYAPSPP